jgi:arylsulfatase A-like enzyme
MALWFGLATGILEVAARFAAKWLDGRVTLEVLRTNHHWAWMVPLSNLALFAAVGLVLAVLAGVGPRWARRAPTFVLCALALAAVTLTIRGLHPLAGAILACGLAARGAPWLEARSASFSRLRKLTFPVLAGFTVIGSGLAYRQVSSAEARAIASLPPATPGAPNVLLLVLDTVRAQQLSLYGYSRDTSPNLARLAARGVRFDQARSPAPWTLPSHASMLTGRWPHELSTTVERALDGTYPTLGDHLSRRGYASAGFVANTYYCNAWYGLDRGFARYVDHPENRSANLLETLRSSTLGQWIFQAADAAGLGLTPTSPRRTAARINQSALDWIDRNPSRPFFVFLNYFDAHGPYIPPPEAPTRFRSPDASEATLRAYRRLRRRADSLDEPEKRQLDALTRTMMDIRRGQYEDCIVYLDEQIGRLCDELEKRGVLDNTLVIITSDHGEHFGEHGLFGHGHSLYRPLVHVPLIVLPPARRAAGMVVREPVSLRDLPATVAHYVDGGTTSPFPGRSLARFWDPALPLQGTDASNPVLSEVEHQRKHRPSPHIPASRGPLWSVTTPENVYIRHSDGGRELFALDGDPAETTNLATRPGAGPLLESLQSELDRVLGRPLSSSAR